jgi:hypothetical protein
MLCWTLLKLFMIFSYKNTIERIKTAFTTLGIIFLDNVRSEQTSQKEAIPDFWYA